MTFATEQLGSLKIFGISNKGALGNSRQGWFYPLYVTRGEAIQADIDSGGKGIYRTLTFVKREGEFYIPDSNKNLGINIDPVIYTFYEGPGAENPFARIQNRLSVLVPDQLPDFIQTEYENFVVFLKAYYEFLEQNDQAQEILQDITKYSDIDETTENLIEKFFKNYAQDITENTAADSRFVLKKAREIYQRKGTSVAYDILFNILFKETIDFFYPNEYILRASSGKWKTPYVLRVRQDFLNQNIYDFENTEIVGDKSKATAIVNKVIKFFISDFEIYEFLLDSNSIKGEFLPEESISAVKRISFENETVLVNLNARTYPIINRVDILDGSLGYEEGASITFSDSNGKGAVARVDGTNSYGSITSINIIEPGVNYSNNTIASAGLPTKTLYGRYSITRGAVTLIFPNQHGMSIGDRISVRYTGNVFSPVDNTTHNAVVVSVPNTKTIRYRYPGF